MATERMTIQLSETAEKLLKRIVGSRLGSGSGSGLHLMCDCMVEHLIHEEARRLGVTDQDLEGKEDNYLVLVCHELAEIEKKEETRRRH